MQLTVQLYKMQVIPDTPVKYYLRSHREEFFVNDWVGLPLEIGFKGEIHCLHCGRTIRKTYGQGYCYPCFLSIPETSECVLRPELCQAHLGISRNMEWSKEHCLQDHFVYLALTSAVKIGITRSSQIPERWIDQGAWKAIRFAHTPNRYTAGLIEVALKNHLPDKTNWRHMLTDKKDDKQNLLEIKASAFKWIPGDLSHFFTYDDTITTIEYPVSSYPLSVHQLNLLNIPSFKGILVGIRGQYLLFKDGTVFNVRAHQGYVVGLTVG